MQNNKSTPSAAASIEAALKLSISILNDKIKRMEEMEKERRARENPLHVFSYQYN